MVKKRTSRKKYLILLTAGIIVCLAILELTGVTHIIHKKTPVSNPSPVITKLPAQSLANNGDKQISSSSSVNQQTAVDQNGQKPAGVSSDPGAWLTSQSGLVTVKTPTSGSTFTPGGTLYGSAKVDLVNYRLIDDQVGVISQGTIKVVAGNFSAAVNFKPYAKTGRLDVFTTDDNGKESNEVQVQVAF